MFSEIAANFPAGGPKAASIISSVSVPAPAPPPIEASRPLEVPRAWAVMWKTSDLVPRSFWPLVGLGALGLLYFFFSKKSRSGPEGHVLPGPPVLRILDPERPERKNADLLGGPVAAAIADPVVVPVVKKPVENIVPVHGAIPVWDMPEEAPYEEKVADPSIDELVKRREAATKELETFMASGLKQIGLKGDVMLTE